MNPIESEEYLVEIQEIAKTDPKKAEKMMEKLVQPNKKLSRKQKKYNQYSNEYSRDNQLSGFASIIVDTFIQEQENDLNEYFLKTKRDLRSYSKEYVHLKKLLVELANSKSFPTGYETLRGISLWHSEYMFNYIHLFNQYRADFKFFDPVKNNSYQEDEDQLNNQRFHYELAVDKMEKEWSRVYQAYSTEIFFAKKHTSLGEQARKQMIDHKKWRAIPIANIIEGIGLPRREDYLKYESPDNLVDYYDVLQTLPEDERYKFHQSFSNAEKILENYVPVVSSDKMDRIDETWLKRQFHIKNFYYPKDYQEDKEKWPKFYGIHEEITLALANKTMEYALLDKKVALLIAGFLGAMIKRSNHWHCTDSRNKVLINPMTKMRKMLIQYYIDSNQVSHEDIHRYFIEHFRDWWD